MATAPKASEAAKAKLNVAQRINAVQQRVDYIQKEDKAGMRFKIVSHDKVTALVRPHLVEQGVLYYPINMVTAIDGNRVEAVFDVRFENIDDRSDFIDVATFGFGIDPQDKGPGKAISYGVKYALLKCLGLETGDDPDNESIDHQSRLDQQAFDIENLVGTCMTMGELEALMADASTVQLMTKLVGSNKGKHAHLKGLMVRKAKELRDNEGQQA